MSKYISVVIFDGISTSACNYMGSDCDHEEISVLVELRPVIFLRLYKFSFQF